MSSVRPSVRPSVRVESPSVSAPVTSGSRTRLANDSCAPSASTTSYLTRARLRQVEESLSERDWRIVTAVGMLRFVTGDQLRRLFFTSGSVDSNARLARQVLRRLVLLRLLVRLERRVGGVRAGSAGSVFCLDLAGQALLFSGRMSRRRRPVEPSFPFVRHQLAIAEVVVRLQQAHDHGVLGLMDVETEPDCWRSFTGPDGAPARLKPDLFVRTGLGDLEELAFLEIDLGTESLPTIETKLRTHARYAATGRELQRWEVIPRVVFVVASRHRRDRLTDLFDRQPRPLRKLFAVRELDDIVAALTPADNTEESA